MSNIIYFIDSNLLVPSNFPTHFNNSEEIVNYYINNPIVFGGLNNIITNNLKAYDLHYTTVGINYPCPAQGNVYLCKNITFSTPVGSKFYYVLDTAFQLINFLTFKGGYLQAGRPNKCCFIYSSLNALNSVFST